MTNLSSKTVDLGDEVLPLSKDYFLTQGGSCSQVPMVSETESSEWPYKLSKMKKCDKPGKHPHHVVREGPAVGRRRKANAARV
mgnify:CR=1 FL=1